MLAGVQSFPFRDDYGTAMNTRGGPRYDPFGDQPAQNCLQLRSNSFNLPFSACSLGFPALWIHTSTLLHWISCVVLGAFTVTVSRVAGRGVFAVKPIP